MNSDPYNMITNKFAALYSAFGVITFATLLTYSCTHDPFLDPATLNEGNPSTPGCQTESEGLVCFESSVLPIFQSSCAKSGCHDAQTHEEDYILDNYNTIVRKGIKPGNAAESKLYKVLFAGGEDLMPPGEPLTQAQKDSIKLWIDQGAKNTVNCNCFCDSTKYAFTANIHPIIQNYCEGCHKPGNVSGGVDLSTYAKIVSEANSGNLLGSIIHASGYQPMPPSGKLTECEIAQVKKWIETGSTNN